MAYPEILSRCHARIRSYQGRTLDSTAGRLQGAPNTPARPMSSGKDLPPVKKPFRIGQFPDPGEILSPQEPGLGDLPVRGPNRICANTRRISYISNLLLDMPSSFTRGTVIHVALRSKSCYRTQGRVTPIRKWPD